MYLKEAIILLAKVFDHIPTYYIHKMVYDKKSLFDTYLHLDEQETKFNITSPRPYPRLRLPRVVIEKKYQLTPREQRNPIQYAQQVNEFQAAKQHCARQAHRGRMKAEKDEAEAINEREHRAIGAVTPCGCCFEEAVPLNRVVVFVYSSGFSGGAYRVSNPEPLVPQTSALPIELKAPCVF